MAVAVYPALVTGGQVQGYRADLVDFPGVAAEGADHAALLAAARALLRERLGALEREGSDWPSPTPVETLGAQLASGAALLLVDAQVEDAPVRVNISIGESLLRRLDAAAEAQNMSRSGFIAAAVRQRLGPERPGQGAGAERLADEMSELGRRLNQALGPDSAFSRTVAELDERAMAGLRTLAERLRGGAGPRPNRHESGGGA